MGHLDRSQLADADRLRILLILFDELIVQLKDTPDTATEKSVITLDVIRTNRDILDTQIHKGSLIPVFLCIQHDRNPIDDRITPTLTEHCQDLLGFIRTHIIVPEYTLHILNSFIDDLFII